MKFCKQTLAATCLLIGLILSPSEGKADCNIVEAANAWVASGASSSCIFQGIMAVPGCRLYVSCSGSNTYWQDVNQEDIKKLTNCDGKLRVIEPGGYCPGMFDVDRAQSDWMNSQASKGIYPPPKYAKSSPNCSISKISDVGGNCSFQASCQDFLGHSYPQSYSVESDKMVDLVNCNGKLQLKRDHCPCDTNAAAGNISTEIYNEYQPSFQDGDVNEGGNCHFSGAANGNTYGLWFNQIDLKNIVKCSNGAPGIQGDPGCVGKGEKESKASPKNMLQKPMVLQTLNKQAAFQPISKPVAPQTPNKSEAPEPQNKGIPKPPSKPADPQPQTTTLKK